MAVPDLVIALPGRFLVRGNFAKSQKCYPLVVTNESLSFWGGIDEKTGVIVDHLHPLIGTNVRDTIFCLPSGRGSCTGSQVLLELILNDLAPAGIIFRDVDGIASVGALIAQEIFGRSQLAIVCVGDKGFATLLQHKRQGKYGCISADGTLLVCSNESHLLEAVCSTTDDGSTDGSLVSPLGENAAFANFNVGEQRRLDKASNEAERMALRVLFRYAQIVTGVDDDASAPRTYLPVASAHIDGCTYIGPGGLELAQRLCNLDGKVSVPTTLNSMSTDRSRWRVLGVPEPYAHNAIALSDAYLQLGCQASFTCAPYLLPSAPKIGQHVVWGESNAVVYANSVLGARTEKTADYLDICCAIAGLVPAAGVHLDEHRVPRKLLVATNIVQELVALGDAVDWDVIFPVLGHLCGSLSDGKVPLLVGLEALHKTTKVIIQPEIHLKAFCAAFGTTAASPLIHIAGVTPEACSDVIVSGWKEDLRATNDSVNLSMRHLDNTFHTLNSDGLKSTSNGRVDLIALGNPHLSIEDCRQLSQFVQELPALQKHDNLRVLACMSQALQSEARTAGHIEPLERFGIEFVNDTCWCMLLDPPVIPAKSDARILTNSGKYAHYGPGLTSRAFQFGSTFDCIQAAVKGTHERPAGLAWYTRPSRPSLQRSLTTVARAMTRRVGR